MSKSLTQKVLLIGWDAADWKVITPLMDAGKMPNLARFADEGVVGNLATVYPVLSPMLWTSIATGKYAHKHGIHGFVEPDPASGGVRPITNLGRKTKAIWNILNQLGMRTNVIGWWPSHPAEPINGVMVSNHYQQVVNRPDKSWPMKPGAVHPERLRQPLAELRVHPGELTPEQILPFVPKAAQIDQETDKRLGSIAKILAECASVHSAATAVMQLEPWDFMAIYYDAIDHFCHGFMKYHPPKLPWIEEQDYEFYKDVINTAYQFHDLMLGVLMRQAGEDTTIIVVSDHGFHPDHLRPRELPNEPAGPAEEHRHFGIFAALGPGIKQDELVFGASLLDITPTILTLYGVPVGRDMDGKPLVAALDGNPLADYVDSWDDIAGKDGTHPPDACADAVDSQEAINQLVELGYIEEPDADKGEAINNTVKELRYNLARNLMHARQHNEAIPILRELWDEHEEESRFGLKLFESFLALGRIVEARETLENIKARKQRLSECAVEKLKSLKEKYSDKKPENLEPQVIQNLRKFTRQASTNQATLSYLEGRLLQAEGELEASLEALDKADGVQQHNHPDLYQTKGDVLYAMGKRNKAEASYRKVLELDPASPGAQLGLCRCYLAMRNMTQEALDAAMACIGFTYHNPQAHFLCGVALHRLGRIRDAQQAYETALAQNPVFPAAHRRLARLYRLPLNNPDKANEHIMLARAAQSKVAEFRAGKVPTTPSETMLDTVTVASIGAIGSNMEIPSYSTEDIVIVSGLPRSGTSMMMQMLEAGGLPILTDNARKADESNPRGYYEFEGTKKLATDREWLKKARGKSVKVVAQLLPELIQGEHYRVLFMERPLKEVIQSQTIMLERLGRRGGRLSSHRLAETYLKQMDQICMVLENHKDNLVVMSVNYHEALNDPQSIAAKVNQFLGGSLNEEAMAATIDPSLRRQII